MLLGEESVKSALTTEFIEEKLELYREKREEMFGTSEEFCRRATNSPYRFR